MRDGLLASHHLLLAHGRVVEELRRRDASLRLGITLNLTVADPVDPADPADVDAARRIDGQFNRWFLEPLRRAAYPDDVVADIRTVDAEAIAAFEHAIRSGDLETIAAPIDFLGVNYYHGEHVSGHPAAVPPVGGEAPTVLEGVGGGQMRPAVREGVGGDVEDPHHEGVLARGEMGRQPGGVPDGRDGRGRRCGRHRCGRHRLSPAG